jgi:hypothetical protein
VLTIQPSVAKIFLLVERRDLIFGLIGNRPRGKLTRLLKVDVECEQLAGGIRVQKIVTKGLLTFEMSFKISPAPRNALAVVLTCGSMRGPVSTGMLNRLYVLPSYELFMQELGEFRQEK